MTIDMKTILCYGDSNTWGFKSRLSLTRVERYAKPERWTGILESLLGEEYTIIEEGNSGRTTVWEDPIHAYKNGKKTLIPCLDSHQPLDLVIILLGTNDLKHRFGKSAFDIALGAKVLVKMIQRWEPEAGDAPRIILVAPPPLGELRGAVREVFAGGAAKSKNIAMYFQDVAKETGCMFVDAGIVTTSLVGDGVHFTMEDHQAFGTLIADVVKKILERKSCHPS